MPFGLRVWLDLLDALVDRPGVEPDACENYEGRSLLRGTEVAILRELALLLLMQAGNPSPVTAIRSVW